MLRPGRSVRSSTIHPVASSCLRPALISSVVGIRFHLGVGVGEGRGAVRVAEGPGDFSATGVAVLS